MRSEWKKRFCQENKLTDLNAAFVSHQQIGHLQVPDNEIEEEEDEAEAYLLSH